MCLGALVHARVATLIFGTREPKSGAIVSHPLAVDDGRFNHQPAFIEGILAEECRSLMQRFFAERRKS
jgi:tRNA(adenine34) deaminase